MVATINGKQITAKQAVDLLKPFSAEQRKQLEANLSMAVQQVYMQQQLAEEAANMKLDQQSPYKEELESARQQLLARAYIQKKAESSGPAGDPQVYYSTHPDDFDSVKLSGIFVGFAPPGTPASSANKQVRTEEQAKQKAFDIEKKLKDGGDFATLARTESDNKQTGATGGELGTYTLGNPQIPADLKTAIEKLQTGQVSEPVRVSSAYIIVKVDSRTKIPFEQSRAQIVQKLENEKDQTVLKEEMAKYKIQVQDPAFFASSRPPASHVPSLQRPTAPGPGQPAQPRQPAQPAAKPPASR